VLRAHGTGNKTMHEPLGLALPPTATLNHLPRCALATRIAQGRV